MQASEPMFVIAQPVQCGTRPLISASMSPRPGGEIGQWLWLAKATTSGLSLETLPGIRPRRSPGDRVIPSPGHRPLPLTEMNVRTWEPPIMPSAAHRLIRAPQGGRHKHLLRFPRDRRGISYKG